MLNHPKFGDDYRPCKLTRYVVGVPRRNGQNDFQFAKVLDYKLFSTLLQYSVGKPILIFCPTRKGGYVLHFRHARFYFVSGVFVTAEQLMKEYINNEAKKTTLPWSRPAGYIIRSDTPLKSHSNAEIVTPFPINALMVFNTLI